MKALVVISTIFIVACSSDKKDPIVNLEEENLIEDVIYPNFNFDTLRGYYHGKFGDNVLHLTISHVSPFNAVGYNVVNGLIRNVTGKVEQSADSIILNLAESGEHEYDGVFRITFHRNDLSNKGRWSPFGSGVASKTFQLSKKVAPDYSSDFNFDAAVTEANFLHFFSYPGDSLGNLELSIDGLAVYQHGKVVNMEKDSKFLSAKGSWMYKNKVLTIFWQPNSYFPKLKSTFKIVDERNKEDGWLTLQGEGRTFYSSYEKYF